MWARNKYIVLRRIVQLLFLALFAAANLWGWKVLMGNYSTALVMETVYLSDPYMVLQTLAAGFLLSADALIGALIILMFYAAIAGRSFCSWVCPLNLVTDLAFRMRKKLSWRKKENIMLLGRNSRYWILVLGLLLSAILGVAAFEMISPIGMMHRGVIFGFGMGWAVVLMVFLFDLFVLENGWCGHLCPLGAFYSGLSRFALIKVKHQAENCSNCNKCFPACHEPQVLDIIGKQSGFIRSGACSSCGRCIEVCEDNALKFSINNYKKHRREL